MTAMVMDQYTPDELDRLDMHEAQDAAFDAENAGYDDDPDVATDEDDERQAGDVIVVRHPAAQTVTVAAPPAVDRVVVDREKLTMTIVCTCWRDSVHSPGSVASIRAGDTDPTCPLHGDDDHRA